MSVVIKMVVKCLKLIFLDFYFKYYYFNELITTPINQTFITSFCINFIIIKIKYILIFSYFKYYIHEMNSHQIWFYCYTGLALIYSIFFMHDVMSITIFISILAHFIGLISYGRLIIGVNIFLLWFDAIAKIIGRNKIGNNEFIKE